jgi:hypothetical protein
MTNSERGRKGAKVSLAQRRAEKAEGMAFARAWRLSRAERQPIAAVQHMPFAGHRTQQQVRIDEDAERSFAA